MKTSLRSIHDHEINPANCKLTIDVLDEPGVGGASHLYWVGGFNDEGNPSRQAEPKSAMPILFQNGPIKEAGVNGITHEVLLAIVADRLRSFQEGPYACEENEKALDSIADAMNWLHKRTLGREKRGVEGTHEV